MPSMNKVQIIGYLGQDPELNQTNSGTAVCNMSVATSYKPKNGEEKTEWHRITCWAATAENCDKYLSKGSLVFVEGRLETRKWQDKDGKDRWTTEIVAFQVMFLDRKGGGGGGGGGRIDVPPARDDDDIPF